MHPSLATKPTAHGIHPPAPSQQSRQDMDFADAQSAIDNRQSINPQFSNSASSIQSPAGSRQLTIENDNNKYQISNIQHPVSSNQKLTPSTQHPAPRISILFTILLITTFAYQLSFAQKVTIRDSTTGKHLENVASFNPRKTISTISNKKGVIIIDNFKDNDTLIFQHPAYKTVSYTKTRINEINYNLYLVPDIRMLKEVVLSASKFEEIKDDIPFMMDVIDNGQIEMLNTQTSADVLQISGKVAVQKSQMGGGSPVIRGFEANKILLVLDGVRMNNAIYRSGHLQNVITIDNSILERAEIVFGPGSVVYGSDALGGVMHFYTKKPQLTKNDSLANTKLNAIIRFCSANNEKTTHFDFNFGFKKLGFLTSITHSDFDDLRMGSIRNHGYSDFGKVFDYTRMIDEKDTMFVNKDPNDQKHTGYSQAHLLQKILYVPNDRLNFTLNVQYSTSSDIPRFDKMNDYKGDILKYAEWYYGPQNRFLASLNTDLKSKSKFFDESNLTLAFQKIDENRFTRKFGEQDRINRNEDVWVYSMDIDFIKKINTINKLQYGLEAVHNKVRSTAFSENILNDSTGFASTRYPDGGSIMQTIAGYLFYKWHLGKKTVLNTGIRYSHALLHSDFIDTTVYKFPFDEIDIKTGALTGSAGIVYSPSYGWRLNMTVSSGFRMPNVDDYGKVFAKDEFVVIPNDDLKPEYAYNGEIGIGKSFRNDLLKINVSAFYTYLVDVIVRRNFVLNGEDSLVFDGETLRIQANTNAGEGVIYGGYAGLAANITDNFLFESNLNYTNGRDITDDVPLAHISPFFGKTAISYKYDRLKHLTPLKFMFYVHYNGWKRIKDYSPSTEDNLSEATIDGTPPWYTLNFTSSCKINLYRYRENETERKDVSGTNTLHLQFSIENILDHHYKPFSSGISAPGRNFIVAIRAEF
ncbi:MAG: TonB-dependent receptor [Bacteroidota bacterium]